MQNILHVSPQLWYQLLRTRRLPHVSIDVDSHGYIFSVPHGPSFLHTHTSTPSTTSTQHHSHHPRPTVAIAG